MLNSLGASVWNTAVKWCTSPHTFLQPVISHAQFHLVQQSFQVILFEFAPCVISLGHKSPLLCWLKCYVKSCTCHVCTCKLTHFWCAFFFLQSKRSSTEINTQTAFSRWSCRVQFYEARAQCEARLTSNSIQLRRLLFLKIPDFQNHNLRPQRIVMPELFMWDCTLNHH